MENTPHHPPQLPAAGEQCAKPLAGARPVETRPRVIKRHVPLPARDARARRKIKANKQTSPVPFMSPSARLPQTYQLPLPPPATIAARLPSSLLSNLHPPPPPTKPLLPPLPPFPPHPHPLPATATRPVSSSPAPTPLLRTSHRTPVAYNRHHLIIIIVVIIIIASFLIDPPLSSFHYIPSCLFAAFRLLPRTGTLCVRARVLSLAYYRSRLPSRCHCLPHFRQLHASFPPYSPFDCILPATNLSLVCSFLLLPIPVIAILLFPSPPPLSSLSFLSFSPPHALSLPFSPPSFPLPLLPPHAGARRQPASHGAEGRKRHKLSAFPTYRPCRCTFSPRPIPTARVLPRVFPSTGPSTIAFQSWRT